MAVGIVCSRLHNCISMDLRNSSISNWKSGIVMNQEVIVYILIGLAILVVGHRIYKIITNKHKCCEKGDDGCSCEGCPLANEGCKMREK